MENSTLVNSLSPSMTLALSSKAKEMMKEGIDVINFTVGEPDFDTPEYIRNAAIEAINNGKTRYTDVPGIIELRKEICNKLKCFNNVDYNPENIVVSTGAKQCLVNALLSIIDDDDEVLIPSPYWVSYPSMVTISGGKSVIVNTSKENDFKVTVEELNKVTSNKTKCLILNNPNNPTGSVYSESDLVAIANWAVENKIYVIADEIYERLTFNGSHFSFPSISDEVKDLTILISGFSKSYAMTGWRIGYSASNTAVAKSIIKVQGHVTSNASSISQYAALSALKNETDEIDIMIAEFDKRSKLITKCVSSINDLSINAPNGAFYGFINISKLINRTYKGKEILGSMDLSKILLEDFHVALMPGIAFGNDKYVRISYATSKENIIEGLNRFKSFIDSLD